MAAIDQRANAAANNEPAPDAQKAAGKALRDRVSLGSHGGWKPKHDRPDPLALVQSSDADRIPDLIPIRYGRMLQSPFTFYRGSAGLMASDLATTPATGIPVQACGDTHLMNFGGFATPERNISFDINDFDETLPGPWEWDLKRLVASFVLAARSNRFSDDTARDLASACARSYRKSIHTYAKLDPLGRWYAAIDEEEFLEALPPEHRKRVQGRIEKALAVRGSEIDYPKLAGQTGGKIHIRDSPPLIFHPEESREPNFLGVVDGILAEYRETLPEDRRTLFNHYNFVDAANKVVGIGSVGRRCFIALLMSQANDPLFLQFKEAVPSVLEPYAAKSAHAHQGQRVVVGQRMMQASSDIFLGWMTGPNGRHFYVRQLRDAKIKPAVETFDEELMFVYAKMCGRALARAHAKTGYPWQIYGYIGKSEEFDEAMGAFGIAYANQAERDYDVLRAAVRSGNIPVYTE